MDAVQVGLYDTKESISIQSFLIQSAVVTVTPLGTSKSVTISDCLPTHLSNTRVDKVKVTGLDFEAG